MKPNEIRAELLRRNITVVSIATDLGVKQPTITQVIYGVRATPHIREYIASKIERGVADIWPGGEI